ncbi:carbamoyltransferase family protein [Allosalinactinospora lopnorensis]|uniref:carbamoyltransferase family protein n=1 Tax=Allosalinactinospora lopnorensis TaxID=1352348 RepID=UPI000623BC51|nr:carbamoyltransferase C-terminal domain-containing protein [Allosalinactinospora lopnorensis]
MRVLGVNAVFHDPAAAVVVDGTTAAAAEEERFNRRKHGKRPVPFSAWELPEQAIRWCLERAGLDAADVDAVAYSYAPELVRQEGEGQDPGWEDLRTTYARRAPRFLASAVPGLDAADFRFVPHHVAHAASAGLAAPFGAEGVREGNGANGGRDCAVLVVDGRGESGSYLAGAYRNGKLDILADQPLPHSLGLMYEDLTQHLGFLRSSDEYKVMALASYGTPRFVGPLRERVRTTEKGGFIAEPGDWSRWAPPRPPGREMTSQHADLAASVQRRLEEVLLELAGWLYERTGQRRLAMAGGIALNCVANTRIAAETPFSRVWVQPAAGDAGTALGAALHHAAEAGEHVAPMPGADLGRSWEEDEIAELLREAAVPFERPDDIAEAVADALAADRMVAWFQGRAEFGPRALGRRSLLAHPGRLGNVDRLNAVKGRERFRPVAPMVRGERAGEVFSRGPLPSPYMLFVHDVAPAWRDRIPAVVHVDGTARIQTVDSEAEPLLGRLLERFEARTGLPVVINTSLNTAGRPMVDSPRDVLECFGATPIDLLAIGPFAVRRSGRPGGGVYGR